MANPARVLEVGCGGGELAARLFGRPAGGRPIAYTGIDISPAQVEAAQARLPGQTVRVGSAYSLPFPDRSFDLVVLCEVLEHLDRPADGLDEAVRVAGGHVLVSVPWEPVWRVLNLARGKYWSHLGTTPGHIQHFSRRRIRNLLSDRLMLAAEQRPFPWTMLLGRR
jgi:ubiquinone/menaquinone biosynthesis C-methylase UbiE